MGQHLMNVRRRFTHEMNDSLIAPVTKEEVKQALFQMCPSKGACKFLPDILRVS